MAVSRRFDMADTKLFLSCDTIESGGLNKKGGGGRAGNVDGCEERDVSTQGHSYKVFGNVKQKKKAKWDRRLWRGYRGSVVNQEENRETETNSTKLYESHTEEGGEVSRIFASVPYSPQNPPTVAR